MDEAEISKLFKLNKFRATPQRIAVYKYLCENRTHPDADEIYKSVIQMHPSFSKTTVYNALGALEKQGLIIKINIDSERVRYDSNVKLHGHFICSKCGKIHDFGIDGIKSRLQDDFEVNKQSVYFSGICPECK